MELSRPEYWSGKPFPSPANLPNLGIKLGSPALRVDSLPAERPGKPKNPGVGSLSLLQRIFLTQESNGALLHCRWILHQLSHQGSPQIGITEYNDKSLLCLVDFTEEVVSELSLENTVHPFFCPSSIHPCLFRCLLSSFYRPDILKSVENTDTIPVFKKVVIKSNKNKDFPGGPVVKTRTFYASTAGGMGDPTCCVAWPKIKELRAPFKSIKKRTRCQGNCSDGGYLALEKLRLRKAFTNEATLATSSERMAICRRKGWRVL